MEEGQESRLGCASEANGEGAERRRGRQGGETPTVLLLYVNIYFRRRYPAGDGS